MRRPECSAWLLECCQGVLGSCKDAAMRFLGFSGWSLNNVTLWLLECSAWLLECCQGVLGVR